ncbi:unnamed protein product [Rhizophagus irregularis]|nr:unnamed protein product [Rhizophagus irregularis]
MSSSSVENDQNNQNDQDSTKKKRVKVISGEIYGKKYQHKGSTGILIDHLNGKHQITKETTKQNYVPPEFHGLEITPHEKSCQIELRNLLISWIIFDTQPLNITHSKSFQRFIKELDPAFNIPNVKLIKQTIQSAYNYTLPLIQKFVENNAISINLTTYMWTGRNRQGFLGVTCSFLDKNFTIHKVILTIEYIRYPHTAQNISDALFVILDEWGLRDKTNVIVTDNGANMKKAIKEMNNITSNIKWQPCTAHTLQLRKFKKKSQNQIDVNAGKTSEYFL